MSGAQPVLLLVDDEARILGALQRSLRREGYRLLTAESPREALEIVERERVDAVLSDQKMPGMNGEELLAEVARRQPGAARLLITGWSGALPESEVRALGIRAVIPKPWDDGELKAALREALGGPPSSDAA